MTARHIIRWAGTALQLAGCVILALNVRWSGWAYPPMLAGAFVWLGIATAEADEPLAVLNLAFVAINVVGIMRWLL